MIICLTKQSHNTGTLSIDSYYIFIIFLLWPSFFPTIRKIRFSTYAHILFLLIGPVFNDFPVIVKKSKSPCLASLLLYYFVCYCCGGGLSISCRTTEMLYKITQLSSVSTRKSAGKVEERINCFIMIFIIVVNLVNLALLSVLVPFSHCCGKNAFIKAA